MKKIKIEIEVSNHHIHLSQSALGILFGKNYKLHIKKKLSQADDFASEEFVDLLADDEKTILFKLRIVGPVRNYTQVELSKTDSYTMKINAPLRISSDIKGSVPCVLRGPNGILKLKEGIIIAKRHFHCSEETAEKYGLKTGDKVNLFVSGERAGILNNIIVRVDKNFKDRVHIDYDEANALFVKNGDQGILFFN